jgi:NADH-quinone oxidoreductase subunit J
MNIILLVLALLLAVGSLVVKKSVPSIVSFILMMFVLGLYYINLDAKVLGLFQIFIYTGGIMVLMLFGVTIIGIEYPEAKMRPWAAFSSLLVFVALVALFLKHADTLVLMANSKTEDISLFSASFSDYVVIFALIGSSLLYGTIKMSGILKAKRSKNV